MRMTYSRRKNFAFWIIAVHILGAVTIILFWGEKLFLSETGAQAYLQNRIAKLRGGPVEKSVGLIGREIKRFLDASRHLNQVEVRIDEAGTNRIVFTLTVPWAEKSSKLHQRRGKTTARLVASLLKSAGAERTAVIVKIRRKRILDGGIDPVGRTVYVAESGKVHWFAPGVSLEGVPGKKRRPFPAAVLNSNSVR